MFWTDVPSGKKDAAVQRFLVALADDADMVIAEMNSNPFFVSNLAGFARTRCEAYVRALAARQVAIVNSLTTEVAIHLAQQDAKRS